MEVLILVASTLVNVLVHIFLKGKPGLILMSPALGELSKYIKHEISLQGFFIQIYIYFYIGLINQCLFPVQEVQLILVWLSSVVLKVVGASPQEEQQAVKPVSYSGQTMELHHHVTPWGQKGFFLSAYIVKEAAVQWWILIFEHQMLCRMT